MWPDFIEPLQVEAPYSMVEGTINPSVKLTRFIETFSFVNVLCFAVLVFCLFNVI